ncbi:DEAD/DEAH box helicase [Williamsia sp. M5A3_1d]
MRGVAIALLTELTRVGPLAVEDLAGRLGQPSAAVEQVLVDNDFVFEPTGPDQMWRVLSTESFGRALSLNRPLRQWQVEALQKWFLSGRAGVVEAVTGAGKTDVALAAIVEARRRGLAALVVVPDRQTADAWLRALAIAIPSSIVHRVDAGTGPVDAFPILVAESSMLGDRRLRFGSRERLLVADEVHRLTVADYASLSTIGATRDKLALTATYEWPDLRAERVLKPFFREVIDGCDYQRAVKDGLLDPPGVINVGVHFSTTESDDYRAASDKVSAAARVLQDAGDGAPDGVVVLARRLDADAAPGPLTATARALLHADRDRRLILSRCAQKVSVVATVRQVIRRTGSIGVYFDYNGTEVTDRAEVPAFGTEPGQHRVGVITAAPKTRAAMTSQMSRVLSLTAHTPSLFVCVYVNGTIEDPEVDSHAVDFSPLREIAGAVSDVSTSDVAATLTSRIYETPSGSERADKPVADKEVPLESADTWSVTDAIYDIFDEHQGFPLWSEVKELLPDIEADQALRGGVDGVSWMPIGAAIVGSGGLKKTSRSERLIALAALAELFEALGHKDVELSDLTDTLVGESRLFERLKTGRITELWRAMGGQLVAPRARQRDPFVAAGEDVAGAFAEADLDPALRRVLVAFTTAVQARGGTVRDLGGSRKDEVEVTDARGVRRHVRLATDSGGTWNLPRSELNQASGAVRVFVNPLNHKTFYIFTAAEFREVARDSARRSSARPQGKAKSKFVNLEKSALVAGLDRWDKLGALASEGAVPNVRDDQSPERSTPARVRVTPVVVDSPRPTGKPRNAPVPRVPKPAAPESSGHPVFDSVGRVHVSLTTEAGTVRGLFDTATGHLDVSEAPVASRYGGKQFRNAATASAAIRSMSERRTVFTDGLTDWLVEGTNGQRLVDYLSPESWLVKVPRK